MSNENDSSLKSELVSLLNSDSRENVSNTPDFILADVMMHALESFETCAKRRDQWYGINPEPGKHPGVLE